MLDTQNNESTATADDPNKDNPETPESPENKVQDSNEKATSPTSTVNNNDNDSVKATKALKWKPYNGKVSIYQQELYDSFLENKVITGFSIFAKGSFDVLIPINVVIISLNSDFPSGENDQRSFSGYFYLQRENKSILHYLKGIFTPRYDYNNNDNKIFFNKMLAVNSLEIAETDKVVEEEKKS
jgi:hypothetical protein